MNEICSSFVDTLRELCILYIYDHSSLCEKERMTYGGLDLFPNTDPAIPPCHYLPGFPFREVVWDFQRAPLFSLHHN